MATQLYTNLGAILLAQTIQTELALSKARLFKTDLAVSVSTTIAQLIAAEADFSGYAAKTITVWNDPYFDPAGGATIQSPLEQWSHSGGATGNIVYGMWIESAAGELLLIVKFDEGVPMNTLYQSIPLNVAQNFGR